MARAEVKRCVRPVWKKGVRRRLAKGTLAWRSLWFCSSPRVFVDEAEKNGEMMLQLAYVAVVKHLGVLHVGVYERSAAGVHGERALKGISVLNGESLSHPSLVANPQDERKTFWKNCGFEATGDVQIALLGAGHARVGSAASKDKPKEYVFVVRTVELGYENVPGMLKRIEDLPKVPEDDEGAAAAPAAHKRGWTETDTLTGFYPAAGVLKALKGMQKRRLMDECVLKVLIDGGDAHPEVKGVSESLFRRGVLTGHPVGFTARAMLWLEERVFTLLLTMPFVTVALGYVAARAMEMGVDGALKAGWERVFGKGP